jgi:hypothetical protein
VTFSEDDMQRELLARAAGHAVVDEKGRRVGSVIGIVRDSDTDIEQLAIREEGTFFWRRRLLPVQAVARVVTQKRLVVLGVDREALRPERAVPSGQEGDQGRPPVEGASLMDRIGSYVDRADRTHHLLFVSSSAGYALVEREGAPPAVGSRLDEPDLGGSLIVVKVGSSPLPNDDRACGFVERVV